jgi:WD40 repeat protein
VSPLGEFIVTGRQSLETTRPLRHDDLTHLTMFVGSRDTSVRLWGLIAKSNRDVTLEHIHTYAGHCGEITCLDFSLDLGMIASGSYDRKVAVWDSRSGKLRYMIHDHPTRIISVSINNCNGRIVSVSASHIHVASINGESLALNSFLAYASDNQVMSSPSIVLAPSSKDWYEGVVAVTGHEQGYIYLWKISSSNPKASRSHAEVINLSDENAVDRSLSLAYTIPKCHRAKITCLKLMSGGPSHTNRLKDFVERTFDDSSSLDLYAGDEDGNVSRYSVQRLDQLSQADAQSIISSS